MEPTNPQPIQDPAVMPPISPTTPPVAPTPTPAPPAAPLQPQGGGSKTILWIALLVLVLAILGGVVYFLSAGGNLSFLSQQKGCTQEARICPDGTTVGRVGPNCEFAACPSFQPTPTATPDVTANWKTYTNSKYNYQFKYPTEWQIYPVSTDNIDLSTANSINLKLVADIVPAAETGFNIGVSPESKNLPLSQLCKTEQKDFLCGQAVKSTQVTLNGLTWEQLEENTVSLPPTGYILYDMSRNGNLFFINVYSASKTTIDQVLSTFKFLEATPSASPASSPSATPAY